jgi:hypothetical protein
MTNTKIQMSNQAPNPNVKTLKATPSARARIPESRAGIGALEFDIHLGKSILFSPGIRILKFDIVMDKGNI